MKLLGLNLFSSGADTDRPVRSKSAQREPVEEGSLDLRDVREAATAAPPPEAKVLTVAKEQPAPAPVTPEEPASTPEPVPAILAPVAPEIPAPQTEERPTAAAAAPSTTESEPKERPVAKPVEYKRQKPVVGIVVPSAPESTDAVGRSVEEFGGEARYIVNDGRSPKELLKGVHAVVLPAGRALHAGSSAEANNPTVLQEVEFDTFEIGLAREALKTDVPMRGIGRGEHVLNAAAGGSSRPVSEDDMNHHDRHVVIVQDRTNMRKVLGTEMLRVDSDHETVIDKLGSGFVPVAIAADGTAEGIEYAKNNKVLGVQFRPETAGESSDMRRTFFRSLVDDAERFGAPPPPPPKAESSWSRSSWEDSRPSSSGRSESSAPVSKARTPERVSESQAMRNGLELLDKNGYQIYGDGGVRIQSTQQVDKGGMWNFRAVRSGYKDIEMSRVQFDDLLKSVTPEGRAYLAPWKADVVNQATRLRNLGCNFSKPGMIWGSTPLPLNIQVAFHLQEGLTVEGRNQKFTVRNQTDLTRAEQNILNPPRYYDYRSR